MEYKIDNLNHQGMGITKIDDKITFIPKTIPGDIIKLEIIKEHKNYNDGKLTKIITPSKDRIDFNCPYYDKCGGCHISNLSYNNQLEYKKDKVINIFKKYNKIDIIPEIVPSPSNLHYRNKITLHVKDNTIGLYEEKTNNIININNCLLVSDNINNIINKLNNIKDLNNIDKIEIRELDNNITINIKGNTLTNELKELLSKDNINLYHNNKLIHGKELPIITLDNYKFIVSPESFFQVNTKQTLNLYKEILDISKPTKEDKILDLYCGTGTIGIYLSKYCKEVLGIEINKSSIENANKNKEINNINNIEFKLGDVSKVLDINYKADIIIVDPPRSGLDKNTINTILKIKPKKIIYVSCDPITLSRDINIFKDNYKLNKIKLYDMFPNTYHIETICLLERRKKMSK